MDIDMDTRPASAHDSTIHHKTLSAYYSRLFKLEAYLDSIPGLLDPEDADAYRELLGTTLCAPRGSATVPEYVVPMGSHSEAIDEIMNDMRGRTDVLLMSVRRYQYNTPQNVVPDIPGPSSILLRPPWRVLRIRVGDAAFRHLLLYTSVFLPLGNNCFMQLCGPPVHDMYDSGKRGTKRGARAEEGNARKKTRGGSAAGTALSRHRIYYGHPSRSADGRMMYGLPKSHILNKVVLADDPTSDASLHAQMDLLLDIFPAMRAPSPPAVPTPWERLKGNVRRAEGMLPVMHQLLARHRKTDYRALLTRCLERLEDVDLNAYPPLPDDGDERMCWVRRAPANPVSSEPPLPLQPVSHTQVCRFITSVLRSLLPVSMIGGTDNFKIVVSSARTLVCAKMHEPVTVHALVQGLRVNAFTWLTLGDGPRVPPQEADKRRQLVEQFMFWLFEHVLIPLLRASFYATETATTRYETVYYSHETWSRATEPHLRKLQAELLEELDECESHLASGPLGACAVRLIPKPAGFRPIVNLGRSRGNQKGTSANDVLRGVHQVLTFEKNRKRESLGSCLFGTNEVFTPLRDLREELLVQYGRIPKLFFAKMDIRAAFDTIKQKKVLQVVERLLDENHDYCLMMYALLLPPASKGSQASARRLYKTRAVVADHALAKFERHIRELAEPLRNAVVLDLFRPKPISREECMELLRTHIQRNVWQIGDQYFLQKTGIPQGSKISSLMCSFFYSAMETEHLAWTRRSGTRLLRYIDDFLLITDDYNLARRFVNTMSHGFPEYGASVSAGKTLLSFELAPGGRAAPVALTSSNGSSYFPYCGFLIDTKTLTFGIDIERLMAGPTRQSFALRTSRSRGGNFVGWLSRQLENRNHVAYLDTDHNGQDAVYLNVFLNFAHTALKIHYYELDERKWQLVYQWLCLAVEYTYSAGRARVRHATRTLDNCDREHFAVPQKIFSYLAKAAMYRALVQRPSRLTPVIHLLKRDIDSRENRGIATRVADITLRGWAMIVNRM